MGLCSNKALAAMGLHFAIFLGDKILLFCLQSNMGPKTNRKSYEKSRDTPPSPLPGVFIGAMGQRRIKMSAGDNQADTTSEFSSEEANGSRLRIEKTIH